ncbi:MAG: pyridoxamine 5'-phosphate oxidase family protein, partial [Cyanobacteria bacterium J06627_8]
FVRIEDEQTFIFPDFTGNSHFNTVGNLLLNPKAGFLFIDFETRDVLYLTGTTEIVWNGEKVSAFLGAERFIRFHIEEWRRVRQSLPLQFQFGEYSPVLQHSGSWEQMDDIIPRNRKA